MADGPWWRIRREALAKNETGQRTAVVHWYHPAGWVDEASLAVRLTTEQARAIHRRLSWTARIAVYRIEGVPAMRRWDQL